MYRLARYLRETADFTMLFLPPLIPPLSLGRFGERDLRKISARCTQSNHPFVCITRANEIPIPGFGWSRDNQRVQVRALHVATMHQV